MKYWCALSFMLVMLIHASADEYSDITILENTDRHIVFDWIPGNFRLIESEGGLVNIRFDQATQQDIPGDPDIPVRIITLGIPPSAMARIEVTEVSSGIHSGIDLAPVTLPFKGSTGITEFDHTRRNEIYRLNKSVPGTIAELLPPGTFRDMHVQKIKLSPVRYNPQTRELTVYEKLRIRVTYNAPAAPKQAFRKRGKLDDLYEELILNFEEARNWQQISRPALRKRAELPQGNWYRIKINEDGLYKITASTLSANGISLSGLSVNALRMFNNGGHTLSTRTDAALHNPEYTREIPILTFDLNNNNLFDETDYILFYGKHLNGWFYDEYKKDIDFQQHPYAKENSYWLNVSGPNGLRMTTQPLPVQSAPLQRNYFIDRFHFEEDQYNLLASGPDWYGHRFFGRSGSYTKTFNLKATPVAGIPSRFDIRLKGGSGITFGDYTAYKYFFTIYVNGELAYSNMNSTAYFSRDERKDIYKIFPGNDFLNDGTNTLDITYAGNDDACNAYLDWFEISYPRNLKSESDQLTFYTEQSDQPVRYTLTGFSQKNDIYILDITDPANPVILAEGLSSQNGTISIDMPGNAGVRQIFAGSLSSTAVKSVSTILSHTPGGDLLNINQQADFLIITHKTFVPYAEELAERRRTRAVSPLQTKVVTMDDIYFYFNSGVQDPTAIRNFIRYAYYNWGSVTPSYVLLFGDGHYDYRNIALPDTNRVPPFEIYDSSEIDSRTVDSYYAHLNFTSFNFSSIDPDLAIGRLPMESKIDCERYLEKLINYEINPSQDGWQTMVTFVADDEISGRSENEWDHQDQTEEIAGIPELTRFNLKKIYLSAYPAVAGGLKYLKPAANRDIIDYLNQGTLLINYVGHGSPTTWAHETVFNLSRDLNKINNEGRLAFLYAATCDFGKYDDPHEPSFSEALIWKEKSGVIGVMASSRLVFSNQNKELNKRFYRNLFPSGQASRPLGKAFVMAVYPSTNDQKYHLFADPTMYLADPREKLEITGMTPDTLKALSEVEVTARVLNGNQELNSDFTGGAVLIVNDARYDSVNTGGNRYYSMAGPLVFKGEVSVVAGELNGRFIVPKSIRYVNKKTGKLTIFAWNHSGNLTALGYNSQLLLTGSVANVKDSDGPRIDIYFQNQENFTSGDLIQKNPVLLAELEDQNGINMTGETGYQIQLAIDSDTPKNISGFFSYERDSYSKGFIKYPMEELKPGQHLLKISAFDNLNNLSESEILFTVASTSELEIADVVNYPNPFRNSTDFTFQTNREAAEVTIKIYTINGRLIQTLEGTISELGYNQIPWDGRDRDGDRLANGVYLYKIILRDGREKVEKIEKMVVIN